MSILAAQGTRTEGSMAGGETRARNEAKFSHISGDGSRPTVCGAFSAEFMILNNTRGWWLFTVTISEKYFLFASLTVYW